jgi:hypothetical protein
MLWISRIFSPAEAAARSCGFVPSEETPDLGFVDIAGGSRSSDGHDAAPDAMLALRERVCPSETLGQPIEALEHTPLARSWRDQRRQCAPQITPSLL